MSTTLFRAVLSASLVTLVALMYFVGGDRWMSPDVFGTLRVVAATLWIAAIAIRCTETVLERLDEPGCGPREKNRIKRKDRQAADATIRLLGGSRARPGVLTPVD